MRIRTLRDDDLPACVELNNDNVPAVSFADDGRMRWLIEQSLVSLVAEENDELIAFCVTFAPGTEYDSVNYRWFSERFDDFAYLDRIVVAASTRDRGIGAAMYAALEERIQGTPRLLCEVNLRPRNDGSLRFHSRLGFVEVGQQETPYGALVSMLAKDLP
jgi:uncharacterized protein